MPRTAAAAAPAAAVTTADGLATHLTAAAAASNAAVAAAAAAVRPPSSGLLQPSQIEAALVNELVNSILFTCLLQVPHNSGNSSQLRRSNLFQQAPTSLVVQQVAPVGARSPSTPICNSSHIHGSFLPSAPSSPLLLK
ncbi:hypothetical protein LIER_43737 [Lithospermum erythrorhizon]|uniref:Secreted protein n=1 Tax=Lithospermum erythrorhizon TaxID=34254 RepID=A0AAV3QPB6_LITER